VPAIIFEEVYEFQYLLFSWLKNSLQSTSSESETLQLKQKPSQFIQLYLVNLFGSDERLPQLGVLYHNYKEPISCKLYFNNIFDKFYYNDGTERITFT
jgi:hypothetical protein